MKVVINGSYGGFSLSKKAVDLLKIFKNDTGLDFYEMKRNDPDLVKVVEELGVEASGDYAELTIVELIDGLSYLIEEYDGLETLIPTVEVTMDELKNGLPDDKLNLLKYTDKLILKGWLM
jgi:hypothetical protein